MFKMPCRNTKQLDDLDSRTKFIAWLVLSFLLFLLKEVSQFVALFLFFVLHFTLYFTKYDCLYILKSWKLFVFIPLINLIANAFFVNGTVLLSWGVLSLTDTDIKIIFRLVFLLVMSKAILLKMEEKALGIAIGSFVYSLSFHRITHSIVPLVVIIIMSFLTNFKVVLFNINASYLIRSSHLTEQTRLSLIKNRIKLLAPILLISLKKTNTVTTALLAKGYHKESTFIDYRTLRYKKGDYIAFTILSCFVFIVLWVL